MTRIAGYNFIYDNAFDWVLIYHANKSILVKPGDPNYILNGQVFEIPAKVFEHRAGRYVAGKDYLIVHGKAPQAGTLEALN